MFKNFAAGFKQGLSSGYRLGDTTTAALRGAIGGGIYGAFSDDTSVLGGMAMGAGLGVVAHGAFNRGARGLGMYKTKRTIGGQGKGQAAWGATQDLARDSWNSISSGITNNKIYGKIKGLASK